MTRTVPADQIEAIVGAKRDPHRHIVRAILGKNLDGGVFILHSADCLATGRPLTECPYSLALDRGMSLQRWVGFFNQPVYVRLIQSDEYVRFADSPPLQLVPDGGVS